jgi:hypothetical protein
MATNESSRGQAGQEHAWGGPRHTSRREAVNMADMAGMVDVG